MRRAPFLSGAVSYENEIPNWKQSWRRVRVGFGCERGFPRLAEKKQKVVSSTNRTRGYRR
jgi:hypothetical protein